MLSFQTTYCVVFLFINLSATNGGLTCLSCKHVVQPGDCFKVTTCGEHEKCAALSGLSQVVRPSPGGNSMTLPPSVIGKRQDKANMTQLPIMSRHTLPPSIIGKRQDPDGETTLCQHCCNSSTICNTGGYCGSLSLNKPGPICYSLYRQWRKCVYTQWKRDTDDGNGQVCEECCEDHLCNNVCTNYVNWNAPFTKPANNITSIEPTTSSLELTSMKTGATTTRMTEMSTLEIKTTSLPTTETSTTKIPTTEIPTTKIPTTEIPTTKIPTTKTTTLLTTEIPTTKIPTTTTTTLPTTTLDPVVIVNCYLITDPVVIVNCYLITDPVVIVNCYLITDPVVMINCDLISDPVVMVNCNFESGLCNWHQDKMDDGDWRIHSGPTATDNTGPKSDHTLRTVKGHYLYLEASDMNYQNFVRLLSNDIVWPQKTCLTFWYHMFGHFIASLSVYTKDSHGNLQKLWSQSGNHGNNWLPAKINLPNTPGQIVIEGYRGADIHGDIAVDDIKLVRNCNP
ncbi:MAM and LDL-receptor class A domain-containing protein 1 [Mytilus coruscus]|uniref:MAM and LDL-receptor class A domain-containing protein 1 n=1 Tax=Mytilus coruscus TaxID=42192 RepID=A0A6J8B410_MYTCO|nr:MAM and LDL-receptor class A domain-containing protein 1 [Mytilus coruscus]